MMDCFSQYMNKVKADNELKENTKSFVRSAFLKETQQKTNANTAILCIKNKTAVKKLLIAVSSVAACAMLTVGGYAYYNTPVNYISFDINPSVELGINAFDVVVSTEGCNEDGNLLLEENELTNLSVEEAMDTLVQEAEEQGFIEEDGSTVIAVTTESDNEETAENLQSISEAGINLALNAKNVAAIVYADCSSLELRTEAKELGISPGKYKLIQILQMLDSGITIEQYKDAKITHIMSKTSELLASSAKSDEQYGEYAKSLEMIVDAAQKVQATNGTVKKEQNSNNNQTQKQDSKVSEQKQEKEENQSQNQASSSIQDQKQEQNKNQNQPSSGVKQEQEQNKVQVADMQTGTLNTKQKENSNDQNGLSNPAKEQKPTSNENTTVGSTQPKAEASRNDNSQNENKTKRN